MKRPLTAPITTPDTPTQTSIFGNVARGVGQVGVITRRLGHAAVRTVLELPGPVREAVQTSATKVGKLSLRGLMARSDYERHVSDPTPENKMRLDNSTRYAVEEAKNPDAPTNRADASNNKATYDWGTSSVEVAPPTIGGEQGYREPQKPTPNRPIGAVPMQINSPATGGFVYTQAELNELHNMPTSEGLTHEQFGYTPNHEQNQQ